MESNTIVLKSTLFAIENVNNAGPQCLYVSILFYLQYYLIMINFILEKRGVNNFIFAIVAVCYLVERFNDDIVFF